MVSCPKEDDSSTGLPFKNLSGVFILTGAGFATGFLMLGIECIVFKWKKRKVKRYWVKSNVPYFKIHVSGIGSYDFKLIFFFK